MYVKLSELELRVRQCVAYPTPLQWEAYDQLQTRLLQAKSSFVRGDCGRGLIAGDWGSSQRIVKWRYQALVMQLHWSFFCAVSGDDTERNSTPNAAAPAAAALALEISLTLSREIVEDIEREWVRNQIASWTAARVLQQAARVSTLGFSWASGPARVSDWQRQVYRVISLLRLMKEWSWEAVDIQNDVWSMYSEKWRTYPNL